MTSENKTSWAKALLEIFQVILKAFSSQQVRIEQIPDVAKMKSFIVWFN